MNDLLISQIKKEIFLEQFFAFNVWDINSAKAVIDASKLKDKLSFLQISSKVFRKLDKEEFIYAIKRYAHYKDTRVVIHLDHSKDIEQIKEAIQYGWDSVMFDGSHLSLEENIRITNEVSNICKFEGVLVEAEIGQIKGVEDDINVTDNCIVNLKDVEKFIKDTNIDMLAVAIGTSHGQYGNKIPKINYDIIQEVEKLTNLPFVVHGGSELSSEVIRRLFSYRNVKKINISTDVKQAYRKGILAAIEYGLLEGSGFDANKVNEMIYNNISELISSKLEILEGE